MAVTIEKNSFTIDLLSRFLKGYVSENHNCISGGCCSFTIMMHRNLGWQIIGLKREEGDTIIHAGVRSPEGDIWDGRGKVSEAEFIRPFTEKDYRYYMAHITEKDLSEANIIVEPEILFLRDKAQLVWPDLPWKEETYHRRAVAFAEELEKLSRKYGLWISSPDNKMSPVIARDYGNESGYELKPLINDSSYAINLSLNK